jgi:6-phosphogluconate dehydrogenase
MGGGMALLFAEHGLTVSLQDPDESVMDELVKEAKEKGFGDRIKKTKSRCSWCQYTTTRR